MLSRPGSKFRSSLLSLVIFSLIWSNLLTAIPCSAIVRHHHLDDARYLKGAEAYPAVGILHTSGGYCTATLIKVPGRPELDGSIILTAAHCLQDALVSKAATEQGKGGAVFCLGDDCQTIALGAHAIFSPLGAQRPRGDFLTQNLERSQGDMALAYLAYKISSVSPAELYLEPTPRAAFEGKILSTIGLGLTGQSNCSLLYEDGQKRLMENPLRLPHGESESAFLLIDFTSEVLSPPSLLRGLPMDGDSGAPGFIEQEGKKKVIGVYVKSKARAFLLERLRVGGDPLLSRGQQTFRNFDKEPQGFSALIDMHDLDKESSFLYVPALRSWFAKVFKNLPDKPGEAAGSFWGREPSASVLIQDRGAMKDDRQSLSQGCSLPLSRKEGEFLYRLEKAAKCPVPSPASVASFSSSSSSSSSYPVDHRSLHSLGAPSSSDNLLSSTTRYYSMLSTMYTPSYVLDAYQRGDSIPQKFSEFGEWYGDQVWNARPRGISSQNSEWFKDSLSDRDRHEPGKEFFEGQEAPLWSSLSASAGRQHMVEEYLTRYGMDSLPPSQRNEAGVSSAILERVMKEPMARTFEEVKAHSERVSQAVSLYHQAFLNARRPQEKEPYTLGQVEQQLQKMETSITAMVPKEVWTQEGSTWKEIPKVEEQKLEFKPILLMEARRTTWEEESRMWQAKREAMLREFDEIRARSGLAAFRPVSTASAPSFEFMFAAMQGLPRELSVLLAPRPPKEFTDGYEMEGSLASPMVVGTTLGTGVVMEHPRGYPMGAVLGGAVERWVSPERMMAYVDRLYREERAAGASRNEADVRVVDRVLREERLGHYRLLPAEQGQITLAYAGPVVGLLGSTAAAGGKGVTEAVVDLGSLGTTLGDGLESLAVTLEGQIKAPVTQGNRLWYAERGEKELGVLPDQGSGAASSKEEPEVHATEKPERVMLAYAGPMAGLLGPAVAAGAKAVTEAVVGTGVGAMAGAVLKETVEKLTTPAHEPSPCETQEGFDQAAAAPSTLATPMAEDPSLKRESFPAASPAPMGPTETYPADIEAPDTTRLFKGTSEEGRKINPAKADSAIWKELKPYRKDIKTNGLSGNKKRYYKWDYTHNDIEVYNNEGVHLGSRDPISGEVYKSKVKNRSIKEEL